MKALWPRKNPPFIVLFGIYSIKLGYLIFYSYILYIKIPTLAVESRKTSLKKNQRIEEQFYLLRTEKNVIPLQAEGKKNISNFIGFLLDLLNKIWEIPMEFFCTRNLGFIRHLMAFFGTSNTFFGAWFLSFCKSFLGFYFLFVFFTILS